MRFEWDDEKNQINIRKHHIDFGTAILVFADPQRLEYYDAAHSADEDRYVTIGSINGVTLIVMVVFTERTNSIRIISACPATKREKEVYYHDRNYGSY